MSKREGKLPIHERSQAINGWQTVTFPMLPSDDEVETPLETPPRLPTPVLPSGQKQTPARALPLRERQQPAPALLPSTLPSEREPPTPVLPPRQPDLNPTSIIPLAKSRVVWVDGLNPRMTSRAIKCLFDLKGMLQIFDVQPSGCIVKPESTTFAKVRFFTAEDARMAAHHLDGTMRNGYKLQVGQTFDDPLIPEPPPRINVPGLPTRNVQINYFPTTITEDQIRAHFDVVGKILEVKIAVDPNQIGPFRFAQAVVQFSTVAEAETAIDIFDGTILMKYWRLHLVFR